MRQLLSIVTFFFVVGATNAQDIAIQGYVKDLAGWVDQRPTMGTLTLGHIHNTFQNRLTTRYYPSSTLTLACDLRTRMIYQREFNAGGMFTSALQGASELLDLNAVLIDRDDAVLVSQVDRLSVDWILGPLQLTVGRQRIAWGTNLVWNPTDLFNPFSVLDFDYEERPGVDGFRAQIFTGPTSKIELAVAPGKTSRNRAVMALVHVNSWSYDFNMMGGVFQEGYVLGFSWAGQVLDAGFRGEVRWTGNQHSADPTTLSDARQSYFIATLSGDYTFANSLYLHTEVLFNGNGVSEDAGPRWAVALSRGLLSPARWSVYQEVSGNISALVRLSMFGLINPEDDSFVLVPSLTWSVATNWDILVIALIPAGQTRTEFGGMGSGAYARVKWSF
ncbi:MAG: hypothetical protein IT282_07140 [Bacteroidetes bacterium]|nr:hypothetical protein [Bacteroidota bacterium]